MENISGSLIILFLLAAAAIVWIFFKAAKYSTPVIVVVLMWMLLQCILGIRGFYTQWNAIPPRFLFLVVPPLLFIIILTILPAGKRFLDSLNLKSLTFLHSIRIIMEITLYYLLAAKLIPKSMTFEGSNFDIISGLTAPLVYYFVFVAKKKANPKILLAWNFICLGLLLNVVITAILSARTPFQRFAFDQPNIGVAYFPFVLLPSVVVPIVLLAHLAAIKQLLGTKQQHPSFKTAPARKQALY